MNHPYVKRFIEERELTLFILADISGSGKFGSRKETKKDNFGANRRDKTLKERFKSRFFIGTD